MIYFDFDLDFSDIMDNDCNVGPLFCGPPTISFGSGEAKGNAIIGLTGTLLGVDIITPGGDYIGPPKVKFNDSCNNVITGRFSEHMVVDIQNDGPVTIMLDSVDRLKPRNQ